MQKLDNKIAFVTGGSRGIGYGVAESMLHEGMRVAITSRSENSAKAAADRLKKIGSGEVMAVAADVRDASALNAAVDVVGKTWGDVDVLIANAGVGHFAPIDVISAEQWNETIDINLTGVFHSVKACVPALKRTHGFIITIASLAGTNFFAGGAAYNASKFGLVGFTQAIMLDLRNYGIRVSTIMPGSVATEFNDHKPSEKDAWKIQPEDIGQMVVDLLKLNSRTLPSKIEVRPSIVKS